MLFFLFLDMDNQKLCVSKGRIRLSGKQLTRTTANQDLSIVGTLMSLQEPCIQYIYT